MGVEERIRLAISDAIDALVARDQLPGEACAATFHVERSKHVDHGDLATNVAMVLAKVAKRKPRDLAELIGKELESDGDIAAVEVAGPGFLNVRLLPSAFHAVLREVEQQGVAYGRGPSATGERLLLEFVSANPTGPLLISHGRGAILGDTVGRLLEAAGHRVTREYYINDFGNQVGLLSRSVRAAAKNEPPPEGGYGAAYVHVLAAWIKENASDLLEDGADPADLARMCVTRMLEGVPGAKELGGIRATLASLHIYFDNWYSEESLHRWGRVRTALERLRAQGNLVELEGGALAFKTEDGEDDKERVVRKSDGQTYTYFASDLAYHADKAGRGYDRLINVLGADHHGYVARLRGGLGALGFPKDHFEVLLYQLVKLLRDGEEVKMGKRLGNLITVDEVIEEIDVAAGRVGAGADALRYYYLCRRTETPIVLDIEQAKKQSLDNPVFYLQYGHARLCALLRRAEETFGLRVPRFQKKHADKLIHPEELSMLMLLGSFPRVVEDAAQERAPHRVVFYLQELSQAFQSYFTRLKNVDRDAILPQSWQREQPGWEESWDWDKTKARLAWVNAIRIVYRAGLDVLGIHAPERMDAPTGESAGVDDDRAPDVPERPA
jgi:arginyl-tRNA synthetase